MKITQKGCAAITSPLPWHILHIIILFDWFGMLDFLLPLGIAIFGGNKFFCNHLCGRGQLFSKLGGDFKCSRNKPTKRTKY